MTAPEQGQCYVVNDVLQHLTTLGTATPRPSPYRRDEEHKNNLSGVILRVADVTSAAIGFHQDADSTQSLVLSEPVFLSDAATEMNGAWFRKMLSAVIDHATRQNFAQIRFLEWEAFDSMPWIAPELALAQFSTPASIVGWRTTAKECLLTPCPATNVRMSTADLHVADIGSQAASTPAFVLTTNHSRARQRYDELAEALDRILDNTDDLTGLQAPDANDLLRKWGTEECTLLVAETETGVAGLCAFAFKPPRDGETAASGQIEYLGVLKELQRQGIATQLLYYLCRGVSSGSDQTVEITAFADETNLPANSFYRQSGFELLCRGKLWYREVGKEPQKKEPS